MDSQQTLGFLVMEARRDVAALGIAPAVVSFMCPHKRQLHTVMEKLMILYTEVCRQTLN
jgi:hypothetical protein